MATEWGKAGHPASKVLRPRTRAGAGVEVFGAQCEMPLDVNLIESCRERPCFLAPKRNHTVKFVDPSFTSKPKHETRNPEPSSRNCQPETLRWKSLQSWLLTGRAARVPVVQTVFLARAGSSLRCRRASAGILERPKTQQLTY